MHTTTSLPPLKINPLYVYRQTDRNGRRISVLTDITVTSLNASAILPHEQILPAKVARILSGVPASTTAFQDFDPVMLTYQGNAAVVRLASQALTGSTAFLRVERDGELHEVFTINSGRLKKLLAIELSRIKTLFIADGHHRVGAATALAKLVKVVSLPAMLIAEDAAHLQSYNRLIDLEDAAQAAKFAATLETQLERLPASASPATGEVDIHVCGEWRRYRLPRSTTGQHDIDSVTLQTEVLAALLHLQDPTRDPRLAFISGREGKRGIEDRIFGQATKVGFVLAPPPVSEVLRLAANGLTLPPHSTWFTGKPLAGLTRLTRSLQHRRSIDERFHEAAVAAT